MVDVVLKHFWWYSTNSLKQKFFGRICMVFSGDYMTLLSVNQSRKWVVQEHCSGCYVITHLLEQTSWASNLWKHMTDLKTIRLVCQKCDKLFQSVLSQLTTSTYRSSAPIQFKWSRKRREPYRGELISFTSKSALHFDLKTIFPQNLGHQYNEAALNAFHGLEVRLKHKCVASSQNSRSSG